MFFTLRAIHQHHTQEMKRIGRCRVWLSIEPQLACFGQIRFTPALMHTLRRIPVDLMGYILLFRFFSSFFLSFFFFLFFFFLFFLLMDFENFVPCSLFCPPVNPHSRAERLLAASSCLFFHLIMASDLRLLNGPVTNWDQILHTENQLAMTTLMSFSVNVPKGR